MALCVLVAGCSVARPPALNLYKNPRYGFTFPYPQGWEAQSPPENQDGQTFIHPDNREVQIQGFVRSQLAGEQMEPPFNFVTNQGIKGVLTPEIGATTSTLTLRMIDNQRYYVWQGRSPSTQFAQYYPLFEQIAREYTIPLPVIQ